MSVKGMQFARVVNDPSVMQGPDVDRQHRRSIHRELLAVDVEAILVLHE